MTADGAGAAEVHAHAPAKDVSQVSERTVMWSEETTPSGRAHPLQGMISCARFQSALKDVCTGYAASARA